MYVVMDGSDLGVGMLFALAPGDADRDAMMSSIAPFWDGNETWLVLGGTLLIAAFPLAYATLLPAFYVPLMVMLFALIFRGVAFEYRFRAGRFRRAWDRAFSGGSALASFCQGLMLGAFVDGIPVRDGAFAGGTADFLGAFAVACGLGLVAGYGLLGATWLIYKTEGTTQRVRPPGRPARPAGDAGLHRPDQRLDAARPPEHRATLVRLAGRRLPVVGAGRDRARRLRRPANDRRAARGAALPARGGPVPAGLPRPGRQPVAFRGALRGEPVAGRLLARHAGVRRRRHRRGRADRARLPGLRLLGLPGQDQDRWRLRGIGRRVERVIAPTRREKAGKADRRQGADPASPYDRARPGRRQGCSVL